jgi:flagellar basal-body rod modification protein FlgD
MTVSSTYANTVTAATTSSTTANAASAVSATNTLTQLAGNFKDFLSLLTTQLKNQDPTSPMDTNQFTSQLVQFTSVAEQISTNATLGSLLTSSLSQQLSQASNLVGREVTFSGTTLPLQNGTASLQFTLPSPQPVTITVSDANGNTVHQETANAAAGANGWTWQGISDSGAKMPDGAYTVGVTSNGGTVPFTGTAKVTGAEQLNQAVQLQFGGASIPFSSIVSLGGASGTGSTGS